MRSLASSRPVAPDVRDVKGDDAVYSLIDFSRDGGAAEYVGVRAADLSGRFLLTGAVAIVR